MKRHPTCAVAAAIMLAAPALARAQAPAAPPSIHVAADATLSVAPDRAEIDLGVSSRAASSRRAASDNAAAVKRVVDGLQPTLGSGDAAKTVGYTLQPQYSNPERGGEPRVTGYTATSIVQVTVADVARLGDVIDSAVAAGANNITGIRFFLHDPDAVYAQALAEAARRARSRANALAAALDLRVVRILNATETSSPAPRPILYAASQAAAPQTPIESGTVDVRAGVALEVEVERAR